MRRVLQKIITACLILGTCGLLGGCGFHLRGQVPLALPLKNLYLQTNDPYGQLARNIKQYLKSSDVQLADSAASSHTVLQILHENTSEQLLSIGGTQQTRQYNITLNVTYQITSPTGTILVPPQSSSETRALTIQSNQILGGSNEENNLFQQMRRAIVYDIMNRLSSHQITAMVMQPVATPPK